MVGLPGFGPKPAICGEGVAAAALELEELGGSLRDIPLLGT